VTVVAVCSTLLGVVPADAEHVRGRDRVGDMWVWADTDLPVRAPRAREADIRRIDVRYRPHTLRLTVRFVELRRTGDRVGIDGSIRGPGWDETYFDVYGKRNHWRGSASLTDIGGTRIACALSFRIDYAANLIVLRVPSECFRNPRWVRLNVDSRHTLAGRDYVQFNDAGFGRNAASDGETWFAWSHRIYPGGTRPGPSHRVAQRVMGTRATRPCPQDSR
jgi:hypothetical protein